MRHVDNFVRVLKDENLWYNFDGNDGDGEIITYQELQERLDSGKLNSFDVSSRPDLIRVFGDVSKAIDVYLHGVENWIDSDVICISNITGFRWSRNSCYMDSTLLAMFGVRKSPFVEYLFVQDLPNVLSENPCDEDVDEDRRLREQVKELLRLEVGQILKGERIVCKEFRRVLGNQCRRSDVEEDFNLNTFQDPNEFYRRLMAATSYTNMIIQTSSQRSHSYNGPIARTNTNDPTTSISLSLDLRSGIKDNKISYPSTWEGDWFEVDVEPRFARTTTKILSADVIVVYIDRGVLGDPSQRQVDRTVIEFDTSIVLKNGDKFELRSAVQREDSGVAHYITSFRCSDTMWFEYDDTKSDQTFLSRRVNSLDKIAEIEQLGVMFFYFKV